MTLEELDQKMKDANDIILNWKKSNDDIEYIHEAIYEALEANREAIIEYIKSK